MGYRAPEGQRLLLALLAAGGLHAIVLLGPGPPIPIQQGVNLLNLDLLLMPETGDAPVAQAPGQAMDTPRPAPAPVPLPSETQASGTGDEIEAPEPAEDAPPDTAPQIVDAPIPAPLSPPSGIEAGEPADGTATLEPVRDTPPQPAPETGDTPAARVPEPPPLPESVPAVEDPVRPVSTEEMLERALGIARAGGESMDQPLGSRPRVRHMDALSTRSAVEASYIEAWVRKVEQVGNQNYPAAARRERLSGTLVLGVLLDQDGQVLSIQLGASSGHAVLDEAAREIVELASPFAPFPMEMRRQYDQLMITRTWAFRGGQLSSGR